MSFNNDLWVRAPPPPLMAFFEQQNLRRLGIAALIGIAVLSFGAVVSIALILGNSYATYPSCGQCPAYSPVVKPVKVLSHNEEEIQKIESVNASDNFTFAVFGDSQDDKKEFPLLKKTLSEIDKGKYLFALETGDMISSGNKENYNIFYNIIKDEKTPLLMAVGNHDVLEGGGQNFSDIFGQPYYSFEYGKSLFIVLDDSDDSRISQDELNWLEQQLKKDYSHKFVFMHKPVFNPTEDINHSLAGSQFAQKFEDLFKKYKPDIVFAGHIHGFFDIEKDGVEYIISGGTGGTLTGTDPEHFFQK